MEIDRLGSGIVIGYPLELYLYPFLSDPAVIERPRAFHRGRAVDDARRYVLLGDGDRAVAWYQKTLAVDLAVVAFHMEAENGVVFF
jgi:hypothetical protein